MTTEALPPKSAQKRSRDDYEDENSIKANANGDSVQNGGT